MSFLGSVIYSKYSKINNKIKINSMFIQIFSKYYYNNNKIHSYFNSFSHLLSITKTKLACKTINNFSRIKIFLWTHKVFVWMSYFNPWAKQHNNSLQWRKECSIIIKLKRQAFILAWLPGQISQCHQNVYNSFYLFYDFSYAIRQWKL